MAEEFQKGSFVVRKNHHSFTSIPFDQAHEQNNKCVKGDVGAVGLTQNSVQLPHWMMSGPEILRAINDFESSLVCNHSKDFDIRHHKQFRGVQSTFRN